MKSTTVWKGNRGFGLATVLLWTFLLASVALVLHLRLSGHLLATADAERQLYSLVLAENGVEYARTVLPHLELDPLLVGLDGRHQGTRSPQWRNPVPYGLAQRTDPEQLRSSRDDGLPFARGGLLLPAGYPAAGGGRFFLRFSNNPEEEADHDSDRVVLVRSLGVVPGFLPDSSAPEVRNAVTLVEARFRQETVFDLISPLTLMGDQAEFQFEGDSFLVDGGERAGAATVSFAPPRLADAFRSALSLRQESRVRGAGSSPSVADATAAYREDAVRKRVFSVRFWEAFEEGLPKFADLPEGGLRFLPEGGTLRGPFRGLLVARGDLEVSDARLEGLLIHLGGGWLRLKDGARVAGGVWASSLDWGSGRVRGEGLRLSLEGDASVVYDRKAVRFALGRIPPTQLGWRILFPEMLR